MVVSVWLCGIMTLPPSQAKEVDLPQDADIEKFVKSKLPGFLTYRTLQNTSSETVKSEVMFHTTLTVVVAQHLFLDATKDAIPDLANQRQLVPNLEPPIILRKVHGAGEILDIPIEVHFKKVRDRWEPSLLDDHKQFEAMGKPMDNFRFGALVYGASDAKRAISDFLKEVKKQASAQKTSKSKPAAGTAEKPKESTTVATSQDASVPDEAAKPADKSDVEKFRELEKNFYVFPDATEKNLQQLESSLEKMLTTSDDDAAVRQAVRKSTSEILALSENYRNSAKMMEFENATTTFNVQMMCENYAKAFKALATGELTEARLSMKRAVDKRKDVRLAVLK